MWTSFGAGIVEDSAVWCVDEDDVMGLFGINLLLKLYILL